VEFALIGPLLIMILIGLIVYGGWLWMAGSVQGLASETARAAIGGLTDDERRLMAEGFFHQAMDDHAALERDRAAIEASTSGDLIRVTIRYDVADHPLMALAGMVPSPPMMIERRAIVRVGGY